MCTHGDQTLGVEANSDFFSTELLCLFPFPVSNWTSVHSSAEHQGLNLCTEHTPPLSHTINSVMYLIAVEEDRRDSNSLTSFPNGSSFPLKEGVAYQLICA